MHFKVLSSCYYIMGAVCIAIGGILEWQAKQEERKVESKTWTQAAEVPDAP